MGILALNYPKIPALTMPLSSIIAQVQENDREYEAQV
jgi:hypothetical protein